MMSSAAMKPPKKDKSSQPKRSKNGMVDISTVLLEEMEREERGPKRSNSDVQKKRTRK